MAAACARTWPRPRPAGARPRAPAEFDTRARRRGAAARARPRVGARRDRRRADDAVRSARPRRGASSSERFAAGVATSTEVLDAQVALLQAELDRTRALANVAPGGGAAGSRAGPLRPWTHGQPRPTPSSVSDLTRRFGEFVAVDHVSFDVRQGRDLRLPRQQRRRQVDDHPDAVRPAQADLRHRDRRRHRRRPRSRRGEAPHRLHVAAFSLYELLTVDQNIRFFGGIYGLDAGAVRRAAAVRASTWPACAGRERTLPRDLAGGWRQRLALGCAILHEPPIVFLDEPTGGVDPVSRRQFWRLIDELAAVGRHRARDHALPRRGGALPPPRDHPRRPAGGDRHHRRAEAGVRRPPDRRDPHAAARST